MLVNPVAVKPVRRKETSGEKFPACSPISTTAAGGGSTCRTTGASRDRSSRNTRGHGQAAVVGCRLVPEALHDGCRGCREAHLFGHRRRHGLCGGMAQRTVCRRLALWLCSFRSISRRISNPGSRTSSPSASTILRLLALVSRGGLYRNVWLVKTATRPRGPLGTYITTPAVSRDAATVNVDFVLENNSVQKVEAAVTTRIHELGPDGRPSVVPVATSEVATVVVDSRARQGGGTIQSAYGESPRLWDLKNPVRYVAVTQSSRTER